MSVIWNDIITIGRSAECTITIDDPRVSRQHCRLTKATDGAFVLEDSSFNGTFYWTRADGVGGGYQRLTAPQRLREGDEFLVARHRFVLSYEGLKVFQPGEVHLDIIGLTQRAGSWASALWPGAFGAPKTLLHDLNFRVRPGELVAIIGGSGAGKSTLLKALTGFRPAVCGHIYFNGVDFYANREAFRPAIGYVPQDDIMHQELTVAQVLRYSAQLRLPPDLSDAEIDGLIDARLRELRLSHRKHALVRTLSGGERKRTNVAIELISRPGLIFLDEPTTGLSPDFEVEFVRLMRSLCGDGRIIVLVTHAEKCIEACDRIVLLAQGGRLVFTGSPTQALEYFGVVDFAEVLEIINRPEPPATHWEQQFAHHELARKNAPRSLHQDTPHVKHDEPAAQRRSGEEPSAERVAQVLAQLGTAGRNTSGFAQWKTLTARYADALWADRSNVAFLLLTPLLVSFFLTRTFSPTLLKVGEFLGEEKKLVLAPVLIFWLVIISLFLGLNNAARELTKERAIFERERAAGVGNAPYILSKVAVLAVVCGLQTLLAIFVVNWRIPLGSGPDMMLMVLLLYATCLCAMLLGLIISAATGSNDQAATFVPLSLVPLFVLAGALGASGSAWFKLLQTLSPSYWAFGGLLHFSGLLARFQKILPGNMSGIVEINLAQLWPAMVLLGIGYFFIAERILWLREKLELWKLAVLSRKSSAAQSTPPLSTPSLSASARHGAPP